ncbi:hypothetical protein ACFOZY_14910 [Chungangia koreensis]|uniref:Uncharacterized protein n=1 Tax=Chungangia koreensis TaxID=752657 RepID=A0ABV8XC02_9LACT
MTKELEQSDVLEKYMNLEKSDIGVLVMGENVNPVSKRPLIRLYLVEKQDEKFNVQKELEAFAFESYGTAHDFLKKLPKMTGVEMLVMLSGKAE